MIDFDFKSWFLAMEAIEDEANPDEEEGYNLGTFLGDEDDSEKPKRRKRKSEDDDDDDSDDDDESSSDEKYIKSKYIWQSKDPETYKTDVDNWLAKGRVGDYPSEYERVPVSDVKAVLPGLGAGFVKKKKKRWKPDWSEAEAAEMKEKERIRTIVNKRRNLGTHIDEIDQQIKDDIGMYKIENGKKIYADKNIAKDLYANSKKIARSYTGVGKNVDAEEIFIDALSLMYGVFETGVLNKGYQRKSSTDPKPASDASPDFKKIQSMRTGPNNTLPDENHESVIRMIARQFDQWAKHIARTTSQYGRVKGYKNVVTGGVGMVEPIPVDPATGKEKDLEFELGKRDMRYRIIGAPDPKELPYIPKSQDLAYNIGNYLRNFNNRQGQKSYEKAIVLYNQLNREAKGQLANDYEWRNLLNCNSDKGNCISSGRVMNKEKAKEMLSTLRQISGRQLTGAESPREAKLFGRVVGVSGYHEFVDAIKKYFTEKTPENAADVNSKFDQLKKTKTAAKVENIGKWQKLVSSIGTEGELNSEDALRRIEELENEGKVDMWELPLKSIKDERAERIWKKLLDSDGKYMTLLDRIEQKLNNATSESEKAKWTAIKKSAPFVLDPDTQWTASDILSNKLVGNIQTASNYHKEILAMARAMAAELGEKEPIPLQHFEMGKTSPIIEKIDEKIRQIHDIQPSTEEEQAKKNSDLLKWRNIKIVAPFVYDELHGGYEAGEAWVHLGEIGDKMTDKEEAKTFDVELDDAKNYVDEIKNIVKKLTKDITGKELSDDDWKQRILDPRVLGDKLPPSPYEQAMMSMTPEQIKNLTPEQRQELAKMKRLYRFVRAPKINPATGEYFKDKKGKPKLFEYPVPADYRREAKGLMPHQKAQRKADREEIDKIAQYYLDELKEFRGKSGSVTPKILAGGKEETPKIIFDLQKAESEYYYTNQELESLKDRLEKSNEKQKPIIQSLITQKQRDLNEKKTKYDNLKKSFDAMPEDQKISLGYSRSGKLPAEDLPFLAKYDKDHETNPLASNKGLVGKVIPKIAEKLRKTLNALSDPRITLADAQKIHRDYLDSLRGNGSLFAVRSFRNPGAGYITGVNDEDILTALKGDKYDPIDIYDTTPKDVVIPRGNKVRTMGGFKIDPYEPVGRSPAERERLMPTTTRRNLSDIEKEEPQTAKPISAAAPIPATPVAPVSPVAAKRGRPRKDAVPEVPPTTATPVADAPPKKRGRPPKPKTEWISLAEHMRFYGRAI